MRICIESLKMLNKTKLFFATIVFLFLYGCSSGYIKYPSYIFTHQEAKTEKIKEKPCINKEELLVFEKGIKYLEVNRCDDAIKYFNGLPKNFKSEYSLAVSYAYCSKIAKAQSLLKRIEPIAIDNIWHSRVYALMSVVDLLYKKKLFKDYATIAYAYDANNRLASVLMFKKNKKITPTERERYFNTIFLWCKEFDVIDGK